MENPQKINIGKRFFRSFFILICAVTVLSMPAEAANENDSSQSEYLFIGNKSLPPMSYMKDGKQVGIIVDLANAIKGRMSSAVSLKFMNWSRAQQLVLEGKADALLQMNPSEEREKIYDFSNPLLESEFSIFISFDREGVYDITSLRGLQVGVEEKGRPIQILKRKPSINLVVIPDIINGFHLLADGTLDAVVVDRWVGSFVIAENKLRKMRITGEPIEKSSSAIAVLKGNKKLLEDINKALAEIKNDGTYTKILSKWSPQEIVFQTKEKVDRQKIILIAILCVFSIMIISGFFLLVEIKKRGQSEGLLRQSEEKYRMLFEESSISLWEQDFSDVKIYFEGLRDSGVKDLRGYFENHPEAVARCAALVKVVDVNKATLELYEAGSIEEFRDGLGAVFGEETNDVFREEIIALIDGETRFESEATTQTLTGDKNHIVLRWSVAQGYEETLSKVLVSVMDITARKQVEENLRESEEKFRNLFSSIRDAILVADTNQQIMDYNPALIDLFGYSEMELLGKQTHLLYADKQQFEELERKLKENSANPQFSYTVWYRKKSGETFPGETGVYYLQESTGEVTGFIGLIRNVADRLGAEATLKQSETRLKSLVDNLFDAILVADINGTIQFANPAAHKLFGKESGQIVGIDFGFPIDLDEAFEIGIVQPDSSVRQVEARATRAEWAGKEACLISLRDITEKRLAEQERDKTNLQLQQIEKIESIGNLAGGIAHDFNNMLTVIIGYGEHLLDNLNPSDPLHDYAGEVVKAGRRSAALTRQLLAFSRQQTLQPEVLDLNFIVENIEKMIHRLIGEDIELTTILGDGLGRVEVDPGQLEQVIVNLAVNARDAMPQGGKLTIETVNTEIDEQYADTHISMAPGDYVLLSITDSGCGMDQETQAKIFEPFFTTKGKDRGTGLGLSTVYGIIKQSGGYIWVYSEPGQGTAFKIYLPRTNEEISGKKTSTGDESITGKGEMVLVVEDEPSLRKLCERMLKLLNYNVTVAANGGEALLLIEEKKFCPDLMITDVIMPEMSGKVLVDRLKKNLPDLKVLYMSGYTDQAIVHHGVLDSGTPFIQKPFNKGKLGKAIRSVLDGS